MPFLNMTDITAPRDVLLKQQSHQADVDSEAQIHEIRPNGDGTSHEEPPRLFTELCPRHISKILGGIHFRLVTTSLKTPAALKPNLLPLSSTEGESATPYLRQSRECRDKGPGQYRRHRIDDELEHTSNPKQLSRPNSPSDSTVTNIFDAHDVRPHIHMTRTAALAEFLEPLLPPSGSTRDTCVLICWGRSNMCRIRGVFVEDPTDEVAMWSDIRHAWIASRSVWVKALTCFLKVKDVKIVTVRATFRHCVTVVF